MTKNMASLTYKDLSFPSKFFYSDGSEDANTILLDETKISPQVHTNDDHFGVQFTVPLQNEIVKKGSDIPVPFPIHKIFDSQIALEAACGDSKFLVSDNAWRF